MNDRKSNDACTMLSITDWLQLHGLEKLLQRMKYQTNYHKSKTICKSFIQLRYKVL